MGFILAVVSGRVSNEEKDVVNEIVDGWHGEFSLLETFILNRRNFDWV